MSFNRLSYDSCGYAYDLNESVKIGDYALKTPRNDTNCFYVNPSVALTSGNSVCSSVIYVDSELMGLNVPATKCPSKKYSPSDKPFCALKHMKDCNGLSSEDTRMSNPPCTLRGTGWNRWEWLPTNPQKEAITPFETMLNNRLIVKDNHKPCLPSFTSAEGVLPESSNMHKEVPQQWDTY